MTDASHDARDKRRLLGEPIPPRLRQPPRVMKPAERVTRIRLVLEAAFAPIELQVRDDSDQHVGHVGAQSGKGHFSVRIVSPVFEGIRPLERHRMIFEALGELMTTDIHALKVSASTPDVKANSTNLAKGSNS